MSIIFVTGLSGVGKSSALEQLAIEGYHVVDTDYGYTKNEVEERVLDEEKISHLIDQYEESHLFISGCYSNQGKFYDRFDCVVLLKAELKVMMDRIDNRTSNPYGKREEEREEIIDSFETVLPLLEKSSDIIIDTSHTGIDTVCEQLKEIM